MFLIEPYPIVEDSNLAKAIRVSLLVGQTGLPNLTQKRMNCLMLLLLFLLVPSDTLHHSLGKLCVSEESIELVIRC